MSGIYGRLPYPLMGLGALLVAVMVGEVVLNALYADPFHPVFVANFLTSVPFALAVVYGGYWLTRSDLRTDRYPRIAGWTLANLALFSLFFALIAALTLENWLPRLGVVRWAVAVGAGGGLAVGVFEARAIHRELLSERIRVRERELRRQNEQLERFASIVSHDLRNPIEAANGDVELARAASDSPEVNERLDGVDRSLDRMEALVEDVLTLAREGKPVTDFEPVDLGGSVEQSWGYVDTADATLEVETDAVVRADASRLEQLTENLIRNAVEHGGADVTVTVGDLEAGFYVEDDGPGVPADERETVFEYGRSTAPDGTGLGLAIVEGIAEAHGWDVSVTEGTAGGARFEVTGVEVRSR